MSKRYFPYHAESPPACVFETAVLENLSLHKPAAEHLEPLVVPVDLHLERWVSERKRAFYPSESIDAKIVSAVEQTDTQIGTATSRRQRAPARGLRACSSDQLEQLLGLFHRKCALLPSDGRQGSAWRRSRRGGTRRQTRGSRACPRAADRSDVRSYEYEAHYRGQYLRKGEGEN
jgi:hypothetical protein